MTTQVAATAAPNLLLSAALSRRLAVGRDGRPTVRVQGRTHPSPDNGNSLLSARETRTPSAWKEGVFMTRSLPLRANLEWLKKLSKERLDALRAGDPTLTLSDAQL